MNYAGRAFIVVIVAITAVIGMGGYFGYTVIVQSKDQTKANGSLLRILLAVSGCEINDTPAECTHKQEERSRIEGEKRVADVECRIRRALAGLPSETVCVPQ